MNSWVTPYCVWCQARGSGKSTLGAPFIMAKGMLFPNHKTYILAGDGSQSKEMFSKIEKIAKKEIESFAGLTDVFLNETVKNTANKDGFKHNPSSYEYNLYNGSATYTLNSNADNLRSKRSQLNFYDEGGFVEEKLYVTTEPFTVVNSDFKMGGDTDVSLRPKQVPNQRIYASSASSIDTYYYLKYKEFAKKMFLGDDRYFVADIKDDLVLNATQYGKIYPVPLLTEEVINVAMRENPEKANREYKNIFSREGGETQAVKRALLIKNSESRPPKLVNDGDNRTKDSKFLLAYDPARSDDNSVSLVGEIYEDPHVGYKLDLVNAVSFADIDKKRKTPLRTPEQIAKLKQMLLDYNGVQSADYENIEMLLIDAGAGGGGVNIGDYLMEDWIDNKGFTHKGLLDFDYKENEVYKKKFPNAVDKVRLIIPTGLRTQMFDAMVEMIKLDLVTFPKEYDTKGYISLFDDKEVVGKDGKKEIEQTSRIYKLSDDEEFALKQIDLMKEEVVNIHRFKGDGTHKYSLPADKKNKMNDDRAFCLSMLCWYLSEKRREHITKKTKKKVDWKEYIMGR